MTSCQSILQQVELKMIWFSLKKKKTMKFHIILRYGVHMYVVKEVDRVELLICTLLGLAG